MGLFNRPLPSDPTAIPWDGGPETANIPLNAPNDPMARSTTGVPADKDPSVSKLPEAAEVITFENAIEAAVVRGDTPFVDKALADDFSMVHGDLWIQRWQSSFSRQQTDFPAESYNQAIRCTRLGFRESRDARGCCHHIRAVRRAEPWRDR